MFVWFELKNVCVVKDLDKRKRIIKSFTYEKKTTQIKAITIRMFRSGLSMVFGIAHPIPSHIESPGFIIINEWKKYQDCIQMIEFLFQSPFFSRMFFFSPWVIIKLFTMKELRERKLKKTLHNTSIDVWPWNIFFWQKFVIAFKQCVLTDVYNKRLLCRIIHDIFS